MKRYVGISEFITSHRTSKSPEQLAAFLEPYGGPGGGGWQKAWTDFRTNNHIYPTCAGTALDPYYFCWKCRDEAVNWLVPEGSGSRYLYFLYDSSEMLIYIGITVDPAERLATHVNDKPVSRMDVVAAFADAYHCEIAEEACIVEFKPPLNRAGVTTPSNRKKVKAA